MTLQICHKFCRWQRTIGSFVIPAILLLSLQLKIDCLFFFLLLFFFFSCQRNVVIACILHWPCFATASKCARLCSDKILQLLRLTRHSEPRCFCCLFVCCLFCLFVLFVCSRRKLHGFASTKYCSCVHWPVTVSSAILSLAGGATSVISVATNTGLWRQNVKTRLYSDKNYACGTSRQ